MEFTFSFLRVTSKCCCFIPKTCYPISTQPFPCPSSTLTLVYIQYILLCLLTPPLLYTVLHSILSHPPLFSCCVPLPPPPSPPCQHALHLFDARHHYHKAACQYVVSLNAMQIQKRTEVLEKMVRCVISLHALLTALPAAPTLFHLSNQYHCYVCHSECHV